MNNRNYKTITLIATSPNLRDEFENHFGFSKYSDKKTKYICTNTVENQEAFMNIDLNEHIDYLFFEIDSFSASNMKYLTKIKDLLRDTEIIVYTNQAEKDTLYKALYSGAAGYLLKDIPVQNINCYLDVVENGGVAISPVMVRYLVEEINQKANENHHSINLSPCQFQMLSLIYEGKEQKEMAIILNIDSNSLRYQMAKLYKKLGTKNRLEAAKKFYEFKDKFNILKNI